MNSEFEVENNPLPRLDKHPHLKSQLLSHCRLNVGDIWEDKISGHRVGCLDSASNSDIEKLMSKDKATLAIHDPPYNLVAFKERSIAEFIEWCNIWVDLTYKHLHDNSSMYIWLGADQNNGFQPLPDFMLMMREKPFIPRSFITVRNQRGYGTQKNWMAIRQELLYYVKGTPVFDVNAEYTDIPKILRGYYKTVEGKLTENLQRSKSETIRAGNVWVDIQQVFYRMQENISGCYAQKPLKCIERIVEASSNPGDLIIDFFSHSGTTLLVSEMLNRRCFTVDIDPVFAEISIRRLERFRQTGSTGWQNSNPFEEELSGCGSGNSSSEPTPIVLE